MQVVLNVSGRAVDLPDRVGDLAKAFGSAMMDENELTILAAAAAVVPVATDGIIVEIGTYVGVTAVFLAQVLGELNRRMPILSIDAFSRVQPDAFNPQGNLAAYLDNIKANVVEGVCIPLVALSADAAVIVASRIGLLIVDGGHTFPIVSRISGFYIAMQDLGRVKLEIRPDDWKSVATVHDQQADPGRNDHGGVRGQCHQRYTDAFNHVRLDVVEIGSQIALRIERIRLHAAERVDTQYRHPPVKFTQDLCEKHRRRPDIGADLDDNAVRRDGHDRGGRGQYGQFILIHHGGTERLCQIADPVG